MQIRFDDAFFDQFGHEVQSQRKMMNGAVSTVRTIYETPGPWYLLTNWAQDMNVYNIGCAQSMKTIIFSLLAAFPAIAVGEPVPEWHAATEGWCLALDKKEACINGPVAVTRISMGSIGFEVTRNEKAKLYLAFDFSLADRDRDVAILKGPFEYQRSDMVGSVRMQTYTTALGDTESSRATTYLLTFDSLTLQIAGDKAAAAALAIDFAKQWSSEKRQGGSE